MEKQEIINRFLAAMKNGKGITATQFAKNNNLDSLDVFCVIIGLRNSGVIIKSGNSVDPTYFLNN